MTVDNPILDLLAAPFRPDWTIDQLAEEVILAIAARASDEIREFVIDAEAIADRQSRRVLRPLLACLATKSAAEAGTSPNLYGGQLAFERPGREGPVQVIGQFENTPGKARGAFRVTDPVNSVLVLRGFANPRGHLHDGMIPTTSEPGMDERKADPSPDRPGWAKFEAGSK